MLKRKKGLKLLAILLSVVQIISLLTGTNTYQVQKVLAAGFENQLVAKFAFDGNLEDSTGNFEAGKVTGNRIGNILAGVDATFASTVNGQAVVLNGTSGIRLPDNILKQDTYTISMWACAESFGGNTTAFFGATTDSNWLSLSPSVYKLPVGNSLTLWTGTPHNSDAATLLKFPLNEWIHIAFTVDQGKVVIYVNGEAKYAGDNFRNVFENEATSVFALGVNYWDIPFKGMFDDLRFYSAALTADDIKTIKGEALYVTEKPEPTSVVMSESELSLSFGAGSQPSDRMATLSATVAPAQALKDIIWSSSDPTVVKVGSSGMVTAFGEGTATIRATSVKNDVFAECVVDVTYLPGVLNSLQDNLTERFHSDFSSLATTGFDIGNATRDVNNGYLSISAGGKGGRSSYNDYNSGTDDIAEYRFSWRPGYAMPRENWYEIYFESLSPSITPVFAIRQVSTATPGYINLEYWVDDGRVGRSNNPVTWTPVPGFKGVSANVFYDLVVTFNYLTKEVWLQVDDFRTEALRFTGKRVDRTLLNGWRVSNWSDIVADPNHIALGISKYIVSTGEYTGPRPDPERVILSQTNVELGFGPGAIIDYNDRIQLTTEVEPSHAFPDITWSSSDSTLVTVDEKGLVQTVATNKEDDGKIVKITAKGVNSTGSPTTAYAECEVTVVYKEFVPQPFVPNFEAYLPNYRTVFGTDFKFTDGTWLFTGVNQRSKIENVDGKEVTNFYLQYEEINQSGNRGRTVPINPAFNRNLGPGAYIYFDWNPGGHTPLELRLRKGDTPVLTLRSLGGTDGIAAYTGLEAENWNSSAPIMIIPKGETTSAWYSFGIDFDFVNSTATVTAWERGKAFTSAVLGTYTFNLMDTQDQIDFMELLNIRDGRNLTSTILLDNIFALREKETDDTITNINIWHDPVKWPDKQPTPEGNSLSSRQYCVIPIGGDWKNYLPEQVLCRLENGTSVYVDVSWQQPEYHNNGVKEESYKFSNDKPGLYTFKGILAEATGLAVNSKNLPVEVYLEYRIEADTTKTNQLKRSAEWLDRGVVALPVADKDGPLDSQVNGLSGILVTWRMLSSEYNTGLTFNVYRNGEKINASPINTLNYVDADGQSGDKYKVEAISLPGKTTDGEIISKEVTAWNNPANDNGPFPYLDIPLQKPKDRPCIANGIGCEANCVVKYSINDCSAADVDGDGQYEILVQWITHARDSSQIGYMAESIFDCYTQEGELLWRMNRGYNIGSGAHYPTMHFYDLDEDGKAEFAMKTGVGTRMFLPKEDGTIDDTTDIPAYVLRTVGDSRSSGKQWTDLGGDQYSSVAIPYAEPIWVPGTAADVNNDPRNANWPIYINGFFGTGPLWQVGAGDYNGIDPVYPAGKILQSPEFISVFDGVTGLPKENGTLPYFAPFDLYGPYWGDGYGNRADRFLGAVAYLPKNGVAGADPYPSIIELRGQYGPGDLGAFQWIDGELKLIWHFTVVSPEDENYMGTSHGGNHNMSVADVDFDGYDEILTGATAINEDGRILWASDDKNGHALAVHGDALHVSVMQPDSNEFSIVLPQEYPPRHGAVALNGSNGELVWSQGTGDTGRAAAFNISPLPGFEVWAAGLAIFNIGNGQYIRDSYYTNGSVWSPEPIANAISVNSALYWDGDLSRELLDNWSSRPHITKFFYNESNPAASKVEGWWRLEGSSMNNGSKSNPCLTLDLYGDWREELLVRRNDENALRIYSSNMPTDNVIYTLMHDPTYRQGVSWQNGGYNQPPHLGFYLGEDIAEKVAMMQLPVPDLNYTANAPVGAEINPYTVIFDKNDFLKADIVTSIIWNDAVEVIDIQHADESIGAYAYAVTGSAITASGSALIVSKEYLVTQPEGDLELKVIFDKGNPVTLHVDIIDTSKSISAVIDPKYGSFDKNYLNQADVTTEITLNDATSVTDIKNQGVSIGLGSYEVVTGGALTVSGTSLIIKNEYLKDQPIGAMTLIIEFDKGNPSIFEINIIDTTAESSIVSATINPGSAGFDKNNLRQADVTTEITLNDANVVTDIKNKGVSIDIGFYEVVTGGDLTVSGASLIIKKEFLSEQPIGTTKLFVEFDKGNYAIFEISIIDTTEEPTIVSATINSGSTSFDKYNSGRSDIISTIIWNDATSITDVKLSGTTIGSSAYNVVGDQLIIKKEYLAKLSVGYQIFNVEFNIGNSVSLIVDIFDTAPSDPIPTSTLEYIKFDKVKIDGIKGYTDVCIYEADKNGILKVTIELPMNEILTVVKENGSTEKPLEFKVPVASKILLKKLVNENVKEVSISILVPTILKDNNNVKMNVNLDKDLIQASIDNKKNINIYIVDEERKESYSWSFVGDNLSNYDQETKNVNLSISMVNLDQVEFDNLVNNNMNTKALVVHFSHEGVLPAQATVRIYVGNQEGIQSEQKVYLYHYNTETEKLEELPYGFDYRVDKEGYITFQILHCSDYVLLTKKVNNKVVTSLIDQIGITSSCKTLYVGGTTGSSSHIQAVLPVTLELVDSLKDKTSSSAVGAATVTYQSSNKKLAIVDSNGKITAKAEGIVSIKATVMLYSGKTKTVVTTITIEKPSVTITKSTSTMKMGDTFTFKAKANGLNDKVSWTTTRKSIIVIDKKTGKATAKSKGTDYVVVKIGNVSKRIKIVVV